MIISYHRPRCLRSGIMLVMAAATVVAVGCGRARLARESEQAKQLLEKAAAAYGSLRSFSERTTIRTENTYADKTITEVTQTSFHYQRPNMIYYKKDTEENPLLWVSDGERMTTYAAGTKRYRETDPPADLATFFRMVRFDNPGLNELALLAGSNPEGVLGRLRLGKAARVAGARTRPVSGDIVSLTRAGERKTEARQTLWIDTKTYMIRRNLVVVKRDDEVTRCDETMHEVKINPDLSADVFKWSPPPGASRTAPQGRPSLPPPQRP